MVDEIITTVSVIHAFVLFWRVFLSVTGTGKYPLSRVTDVAFIGPIPGEVAGDVDSKIVLSLMPRRTVAGSAVTAPVLVAEEVRIPLSVLALALG